MMQMRVMRLRHHGLGVGTVMRVVLERVWVSRLRRLTVPMVIMLVISHRSFCGAKTSESH